MLKPIDHSDSAAWKRRFRAWRISGATTAKRAADRGIAITNRPGRLQVHAWDVPTGELRQLTTHANGIAVAALSPDGRFVYFHDDQMGNELGHVVRMPWEGGDAVDITPDMPAYAFGGIELSLDGSRIALMTATREGFIAYTAPLDADANIGAWTETFRCGVLSALHSLAADGTKLMASTVERSGTTDTGLVLVDVATGRRMAELYDAGGGMQGGIFSPLEGDSRAAGASSASGFMRPFTWDTATGERRDLWRHRRRRLRARVVAGRPQPSAPQHLSRADCSLALRHRSGPRGAPRLPRWHGGRGVHGQRDALRHRHLLGAPAARHRMRCRHR
jgi:hypothetical protein